MRDCRYLEELVEHKAAKDRGILMKRFYGEDKDRETTGMYKEKKGKSI